MKKLLVGILAGMMLTTVGVAVASIPDASGVIHGCYLTSGNPNVRGALRIIDTGAGESCASGEAAIQWNQDTPSGTLYGVQALDGFFTPGVEDRISCPLGYKIIQANAYVTNLSAHAGDAPVIVNVTQSNSLQRTTILDWSLWASELTADSRINWGMICALVKP